MTPMSACRSSKYDEWIPSDSPRLGAPFARSERSGTSYQRGPERNCWCVPCALPSVSASFFAWAALFVRFSPLLPSPACCLVLAEVALQTARACCFRCGLQLLYTLLAPDLHRGCFDLLFCRGPSCLDRVKSLDTTNPLRAIEEVLYSSFLRYPSCRRFGNLAYWCLLPARCVYCTLFPRSVPHRAFVCMRWLTAASRARHLTLSAIDPQFPL